MSHFTPIKFPKFKLPIPERNFNSSIYVNPIKILFTIGIKKINFFDIQCLETIIMPYSFVQIHKDLDSTGIPNIPWSLVCCPDGNEEVIIEIYNQTSETKILNLKSVSQFDMIHLDKNTAKLIETWNLKNGACIFDAGNLWHSASNPTASKKHLLSFRSKTLKTLELLKIALSEINI